MLDFKINRIIGEAYEKILTGGGYLLESSDKRSLILKELQARPEEIMKIYNYIFKTLSKPQIASIYQKVFGTPMKSGDNVAKIYEELGMNSNGVNFLLNYVEPKTIDYVAGMLGVDPRAANNHEQSTLQGQTNNTLVDEITGKIKNLKLKNESLRSLYLKILRNVTDKNSLYTAARKLYNKNEEYYDISAVLVKAMLDKRGTFIVRDFANILRYLNKADLQKANTIVDQYISNKQGGDDKKTNSTENLGGNTKDIQLTNNVQDKVYEDAVRNALKSLGLKDYPKRTALITKIMGRIASRPKNRSYQDQINYIYNYYKNIGKIDLANKVIKIANHIFKNNTNTQGQASNSVNTSNNTTTGKQPTNGKQFDDEWAERVGAKLANDIDGINWHHYTSNPEYAKFIDNGGHPKDFDWSRYGQSKQWGYNPVLKPKNTSNNTSQNSAGQTKTQPTTTRLSQPPTNNRPNRPKNSRNILPSTVVGDDDLI